MEQFKTIKNDVIRYGTKDDIPSILRLTKALAVHEKAPNAVVATEAQLEGWLFEKKWAEVLVAEIDEKVVGMALFYQIFPAYLGRGGLFIDTLYIDFEYRRYGLGKALLKKIAEIALERECMRLEWNCLDSNESSVEFYKHLGGIPLEGCSIFRATGKALENMAKC